MLNVYQSFVVAFAAAVVASVVRLVVVDDDFHLRRLPVYATNFHGLRHDVACNLIADMSLVIYSTEYLLKCH